MITSSKMLYIIIIYFLFIYIYVYTLMHDNKLKPYRNTDVLHVV